MALWSDSEFYQKSKIYIKRFFFLLDKKADVELREEDMIS